MRNPIRFTPTLLAVAMAAAFPWQAASADEVEALTNPGAAEVAIKLPYTNQINPLYRQYEGTNRTGINGNMDVDVVQRSEGGQWTTIKAQNLGLSTQEFGAKFEKQGDWSVGLEYNQIPRYAPYQVNTAVSGVGTNRIVQPSYTASDFTQFTGSYSTITALNPNNSVLGTVTGQNTGGVLANPLLSETTLKTERDITTLTASKFLTDALKLSFSAKNEDKTGVRMDGVRGVASYSYRITSGGTTGNATVGTVNRYAGMLFAPEPINQNHKQFEATLDYVTSKLQISAGYYGSFLQTKDNALSIIGGTNTQLVGATQFASSTLSPIALAPDNSSQQLYVNGGYNFTKDTRATLKLAYTEGRQTDNFLSGQPTAATSVIGTNLDAKVATTEISSNITSKITKDLNLLASWRYENRNDKTPVRTFYANYPNNPESSVSNTGKAEADYKLGNGYGITAGMDYASKRSASWLRPDVAETTYRAALRKNMSESVNGSVMFAHAVRTGGGWGSNPEGAIYPAFLADRIRERVRSMLDWQASDSLNLQFAYEAYFDSFRKNTYGLEDGTGQIGSVDLAYTVSDDWKLNAWYSKQVGDSKQFMRGAACSSVGNASCLFNTTSATLFNWDATLKQDSDQFGLGLTGKWKNIDLGAQYLYSRDTNKQQLGNIPSTTTVDTDLGPATVLNTNATLATGAGVLPDTKYIQNTFKFFGSYPLTKKTTVRLDYVYDLRKIDDYTWKNWVYADGTTVFVKPEQRTQAVGLTLIQSF